MQQAVSGSEFEGSWIFLPGHMLPPVLPDQYDLYAQPKLGSHA
jgi:hypothetical protein